MAVNRRGIVRVTKRYSARTVGGGLRDGYTETTHRPEYRGHENTKIEQVMKTAKGTSNVLGLVVCVASMAPAFLLAGTVDFEGAFYATNPVSQFQDASGTVTGSISVTSRTNAAWIYDTASSGGEDPDLVGPFFKAADRASSPSATVLPGKSFGNAPIIQEQGASNPDDERRGGKIIFSFDQPVKLFSVDLLDASQGGVSLTLFDGSNSVLGTYTNQFNGDSNNQPNWCETVLFGGGVPGVKNLQLDMPGVSGAVDNLEVSAVPIPAAAWLFVSAPSVFGLLGRRES